MGAIVSLSGGMDSTTLLAKILDQGETVIAAVSFVYGSKHNKYELAAAKRIAAHYRVHQIEVDVQSVFKPMVSGLLKSGGDIPEGHYEEETMKQTVVPGRNSVFISILVGLAQSMECSDVFVGMHAGDHAIYPDCRPEFFWMMRAAMLAASEGKVQLHAPFLSDTKKTILDWGIPHEVPYHSTRTCYKDQEIACGKCGSCQERLEAFKDHQMQDPLQYEHRKVMKKGPKK